MTTSISRHSPRPDGIVPGHLHDGGPLRRHASPLSIIVLGLLLAAAMLGLLGGTKSPVRQVETPEARLSVNTPHTMRNGMFFEMRIAATAKRDLTDATIAIPPGLWRDITINSQIPAPSEEEFKNGAFRFRYGPLKAGDTLEVKIDGQINPPLFAGTSGALTLLEGDRAIATIPLTLRVLP